MLYCAKLSSPVERGPYAKLNPTPNQGAIVYCVGALIMQVTKDQVRPAVLFVEEDVRQKGRITLVVEVYSSPLAAMESELFASDKKPSAFEREWLGEDACSAKELRRQIGQWVHMQGYQQMPPWMHDMNDVYGLCRPGVLPLLRLRKPETLTETKLLEATLKMVPRPAAGVIALKEFLAQHAVDAEVQAFTVFTTLDLVPNTTDDPPATCEGATGTLIGPLALAILKNFKNEDYYGVEVDDTLQQGVEEPEEDTQDDPNAAKLQQTIDAIATAESEALVHEDEVEHPGLAYHGNQVLMRLLGPTGRICDSKVIVKTSSPATAADGIVERALCQEDFDFARQTHTEEATLQSRVVAVVRKLEKRYAFLIMTKDEGGVLTSCYLVASTDSHKISHDAVTRYVLCPWVMPVVLDGDIVSELMVKGVKREQFKLTEHSRQHAVQAQTKLGQKLPDDVVAFIREASEGLKALPNLVSRLHEVETALKTVPPAVAPTSGTAAASRPPSQAHCGFKRMCQLIQDYDRTVAQRAD